mmetsp:Transcript_48825/g.110800  ORF Transcript_48825/g.110800 Transcript_48825/m.110800 type:complete len:135 (-) Transcript_48825:236-640(-)
MFARRGIQRLSSFRRPDFARLASQVSITFVDPLSGPVKVKADVGTSLLEVAHKNDLDLEGACGGELACSTCHLVLPPEWYEKSLQLSPKEDEEDDMLDLAWGLTETSRLGCQITVRKELDGLEVHIPDESSNMM